MHIPLAKRLIICLFNIFFPPLAVGLLTGFTSKDTLLNCCLFLLAIIPSHVHGFYISAIYFTRKRRVRNGRWPGSSKKAGIWSEKVLTGGAGWDAARALKRKSANGEQVGSDFDNALDRRASRRSENRRSQRVSGNGYGNGTGSKRGSRRVSSRPQSGGQYASPVEAQGHAEPPMQESGRVTSTRAQGPRQSRRYDGGRTQDL